VGPLCHLVTDIWQQGMDLKAQHANPVDISVEKDPTLAPEKLLEINGGALTSAKNSATMKPMQIKFIPDGPDRTIDDQTVYSKTSKLEGVSAQQTIYDIRQLIAKQENIEVEDVNLYSKNNWMPDDVIVGSAYADWAGYGLENWPPQFACKPRVRGFEVKVKVLACRDTADWKDGKLMTYCNRTYTFDVESSTTVRELKEMLEKRIRIPADRHLLTALIHKNNRSVNGEDVALDDDSRTLGEYGVDGFCPKITFEKNPFDANGMFIFDDAYFDNSGYHPQPLGAWIPQDSIANRARPDAQKNDPNAPAVIVTDRRQAEAAASGKELA